MAIANSVVGIETHTAEIGNYDVTLTIRHGEPEPLWSRKKPRRARLYVDAPDSWLPSSDHLKFTIKGDDPEMDAAWRKYNKAEINAKREAISYANAAFLSKSMDDPMHCTDNSWFNAKELRKMAAWKFSRKAGCSCRCSPGFVAKNYDLPGADIWIRVTEK